MKIQYCSDLHLEFKENKNFLAKNSLQPAGEILLLAGDVIPYHYAYQSTWLCAAAGAKRI